MKQESMPRYVLRITVVLLCIAIVVAGLLAFVNRVTAPVIAAATEERTMEAIRQVLPGEAYTVLTEYADETGLVSTVYENETGYAVEVRPSGFDGAITMMVGVDREGAVLGFRVISHTETSGLGAVAASSNSAGEAFRGQFVGVTGAAAVTKDGGEIDAITNATITSRAVCDGINAALACVEGLRGVG